MMACYQVSILIMANCCGKEKEKETYKIMAMVKNIVYFNYIMIYNYELYDLSFVLNEPYTFSILEFILYIWLSLETQFQIGSSDHTLQCYIFFCEMGKKNTHKILHVR